MQIHQDPQITPNELRFVREYFKTEPRNAAAAYFEVFPHNDRQYAGDNAAHMMARPRVAAEIARWEDMLRRDFKMDLQEWLREVALVAKADPRELSEHHTGACRYCHGTGYLYQRTPAEYARDTEKYMADNGDKDPLGLDFPIKGGIGFNPYKEPSPDCPECHGQGVGYSRFKDTRDLSPAAARIYEGIEQTRDGMKVKIRNRDKSVEMIGRTLGIFKEGLEIGGPGGTPIPVSITATDPTEAAAAYAEIMRGKK